MEVAQRWGRTGIAKAVYAEGLRVLARLLLESSDRFYGVR
ncbi:protein of unknown function [Candidatus Methylocalor cossyra]|uniref:Uncharacterized protein n=1 Tax=Candidatus Methylocalor cossyra TaxID=3108543 RepID=A0ABM9NMA8_9GAMM